MANYKWFRDAVQAAAEAADQANELRYVIEPGAGDPESWVRDEDVPAHAGYRVVSAAELPEARATGWVENIAVRPNCPETREYLAKTAR